MRRFCLAFFLWCLPMLAALAWAAPPAAVPAPSAAEEPLESDEPILLDDPVERLKPTQPRTAAERNKLEALSLFAAGRMKEQQDDLHGALRLYQRALRYDPEALPILREIIRVAFSLERNAEAVRYALLAVELDPSDANRLRQLGLVLSEQGDLEGALNLYERALALLTETTSPVYIAYSMEAGKLYYLTRKLPQSADAFARVMEALTRPEDFGLDDKLQKALAGESGESYELFGEAFLAADRPDDALNAFNKVHELSPHAALHAYRLSRVSAARGESAQALAQLEEYFKARETHYGLVPYTLLSEVLEDLGQQAELIERLEKIRAGDPQNSHLRYFLAEQYRAAGKLDAAEPLYAESIEQAPTVEAYQGLAFIYRQARRADNLLKLLGDVAAKNGGLGALSAEVAAIVGDGELLSALLDAARKRHADDPDSLGYGARLAAALLAMEGKNYQAAEEFFNLALKVNQGNTDETARLLRTWGMGLLIAERYAEAAQVFQRGIDERVLPSTNPEFHFYLSGALALDGRTDEALAAARTAVSLADEPLRFESRIPWILYQAKRYSEAAEEYQKLIDKYEPQHKEEPVRQELRQSRLILSNIYVILGDMPRAEETLEQVLDEFPEDVSALNDLGYLWADQGKNLERALEMVRQAVEAEPDNAAYRDSLGWALYRLGRVAEAVVELEKAAAGEEPDGVILDHLGDAYQALSQVGPAREAWQRALAALEKQGEAEKARLTKEKLDAHPAPQSNPSPPNQ